MRLSSLKFALAAAITMGVVYVVCAVVVAVAPQTAADLISWLTHVTNVGALFHNQLIIQVTIGGFLKGLAEVLVYSFLSVWLFAALYNAMVRKD